MLKLNCFNPKCKHKWIPRKSEAPLTCPKCKSYNWNKPEKFQKEVKENEEAM